MTYVSTCLSCVGLDVPFQNTYTLDLCRPICLLFFFPRSEVERHYSLWCHPTISFMDVLLVLDL